MVDYNSLKVTELKALVKERGIATSAKLKKELVQVLEEHDTGNADSDMADVPDVADDDQMEEGKSDHTGDDADGDTGESVAAVEAEAEAEAPAEAIESGDEMAETMTLAEDSIDDTNESEGRKRKRSDPTQQAEAANKKQKATEEQGAVAPEDEVDYSADHMDEASDGDIDGSKAREGFTESIQTQTPDVDSEATRAGTETRPSKHPATRALYIRELVRPLSTLDLREHVIVLAKAPNAEVDLSVIKQFYLNQLRTHAFVTFTTISAASRVRVSMHDQVWPKGPDRKPLWVDFVPEDQVQSWIDAETAPPGTARWEVTYRTGPNGATTVTHEAQTPTGPAGDRLANSLSQSTRRPSLPDNANPGTPGSRRGSWQHNNNPPTPPSRSGRRDARGGLPGGPLSDGRSRDDHAPAPAHLPAARAAANTQFDTLDSRFPYTQTKPKLYYQPVDPALAARRLAHLDAITSRDWREGRAARDPAAYASGQLYRYHFEGEVCVWSGPDVGSFGREVQGGGGGYRGGGGGRGEGQRGDYRGGGQRGLGSDQYRPRGRGR